MANTLNLLKGPDLEVFWQYIKDTVEIFACLFIMGKVICQSLQP